MKIGIGLVSYGRPDYREQAQGAHEAVLSDVVDSFVLVKDIAPVAAAKNIALNSLLRAECDWIFLAEDDVLPLSDLAVTGYLDACSSSGLHHLSFHAHGYANPAPIGRDGPLTYWPNSVGAWCVYSSECLRVAGLFDENFYNAFEHVEHTQRLASHGFTTPWPQNADATGSEHWLAEIPGSIENSACRAIGTRFDDAKAYWKTSYPDTYARIFGD